MRYIIPILFSCLVLAPFSDANSAHFIEAEVVVYDDRFYKFIDANSQIEVLATELGWAEGPVWIESINSLLFSDVAADKIYQWNEAKGLSVYLYSSGHAPDNSNQLWRESDGPGSTDGMVVHTTDFLFVSIPNGLGILAPEGELLGEIALGQVTNMALNDTVSHLFITSPKRLMRLKINNVK